MQYVNHWFFTFKLGEISHSISKLQNASIILLQNGIRHCFRPKNFEFNPPSKSTKITSFSVIQSTQLVLQTQGHLQHLNSQARAPFSRYLWLQQRDYQNAQQIELSE